MTEARLLAYRDLLHSLEDAPEASDVGPHELAALDPEVVHWKNDPRWVELHRAVVDRLRRVRSA